MAATCVTGKEPSLPGFGCFMSGQRFNGMERVGSDPWSLGRGLLSRIAAVKDESQHVKERIAQATTRHTQSCSHGHAPVQAYFVMHSPSSPFPFFLLMSPWHPGLTACRPTLVSTVSLLTSDKVVQKWVKEENLCYLCFGAFLSPFLSVLSPVMLLPEELTLKCH